jgi:hypothetical protein
MRVTDAGAPRPAWFKMTPEERDMPSDDRRSWTVLINTNDVIVRVQEPPSEPMDAFDVAFEVIDVKAENVTQFQITPEQWYEIRQQVDDLVHKRLA